MRVVFALDCCDREAMSLIATTSWWMHSRSNRSPAQNSLLTGKLTGNFIDSGPLARFSRPIGKQIQWLAAKFPRQRKGTGNFWRANREFFGANREFNRRISESCGP